MASTPEPVERESWSNPVRTIKLCPATTTRPTTLRLAIDRSIAELIRSGQLSRPISFPSVLRAQPALRP